MGALRHAPRESRPWVSKTVTGFLLISSKRG
jgi:hypothetical protein